MNAAEDRALFDDHDASVTVILASQTGVISVAVADDRVGSFQLAKQCTARDVTSTEHGVAVATTEDVLLTAEDGFAPTGFGPAIAVGTHETVVAAGPDGTVATWEEGEWRQLGTCPSVRAIADGFIGTADGLYRCQPDIPHLGLDTVADVTGVPVPRAATQTGVYRLGNGWLDEHAGDATVITGTDTGRVAAVIDDELHQFTDDEWRPQPTPVSTPIADIGFGPRTYAVTTDGTFLISTDEGWRTHHLGVADVTALAVPP